MLVRFVSPCLNKFGPSWPHTCVQAWPKDDATNKFNVTEASVQDWTRWPLRTQYYQLPLGFRESLFVAQDGVHVPFATVHRLFSHTAS